MKCAVGEKKQEIKEEFGKGAAIYSLFRKGSTENVTYTPLKCDYLKGKKM